MSVTHTRFFSQIKLVERDENTSRSVADLTFQDVSMKLKANKMCSDGDGDLSTRGALQIFGGFLLSAITSPFRSFSGQQEGDENSADEVLTSPLVKVHYYQDVAGYIRAPNAGEGIDVLSGADTDPAGAGEQRERGGGGHGAREADVRPVGGAAAQAPAPVLRAARLPGQVTHAARARLGRRALGFPAAGAVARDGGDARAFLPGQHPPHAR
eukprot:735714-Rhodomonas_salina.1